MKLRIFVAHPSVLLTDHRPHGDGLVAFGFIRGLAARGHELHVAAQAVDLRAPLPANVHVYPLGAGRAPAPADRLVFMWQMRGLYRRLARQAPFDLAHQLNPVDVGLSLALADARLPLVLGPYVPEWPGYPKPGGPLLRPAVTRLNRALRSAQQRRATSVLLSSPAAASRLALNGADGLQIRELPPGIDDSAWAPGDGTESQDVLFLANLEVRKGIHVAIDAFARVSRRLPQARLYIGGRGPELQAVQRRLRGSPELERVELLGHIPRERAISAMQASSVFCLPSYGEPFGMTALEAMACAKPVVATDAGGVGYLVSDRGGRKVSPGDSAALADALCELLGDAGLRRSMGEHNRRLVEQRYAWSRVIDRLEDIYAEALRAPRR